MSRDQTSAFTQLMAFTRETEALGQISGRLAWDQETMMPPGAAEQRAEEMAALESVLHSRRTDPRIGDWLDQIAGETADEDSAAQLRLIRQRYERSVKVPARLAAELARVTSLAQTTWAAARAAEDYAAFAPTLAEVIALRREEGEALAQSGDAYDALLNDYEPGATQASLSAMFGGLRPRLVALLDKVLGAPAPQGLTGRFDEAAQLALSRELGVTFGYDFNHGRMDKAVHPFASGSGLDVRITTRTDETDPFNCLYSVIHEVGHGTYEQNIDRRYLLTPVGQGCSMGVHESQSRIFENQIGRSRAFTGHLYRRMGDVFGPLNLGDAEAFYRAVNRVHPGYIRTEADELHYNLHILMRFDLERDLIAGRLSVADLPEAWNSRFAADFGVKVETPSQGCLQDVHWSVGLFGYFPTYTLGNVYAGCLMQALRRDVPDLDEALAKGDPSPATIWLRDKVQRFGGLRSPRETIAHACGFPPDEGPLLAYLEAKFGDLYGL